MGARSLRTKLLQRTLKKYGNTSALFLLISVTTLELITQTVTTSLLIFHFVNCITSTKLHAHRMGRRRLWNGYTVGNSMNTSTCPSEGTHDCFTAVCTPITTPSTCSHTPPSLPHLLTLYPSYLFSTPPTCSHTPPSLTCSHSTPPTCSLPLLLTHTLPLPPSSLLSPSLARTLLTPSLTAFLPPSPKSDTCKTCDSMKTKLESEKDPDTIRCLQGQWDLHKLKAERAYHQLREDTAQCQGSPDMDVITFDLQQFLPTPLLTVNVVYYKRQLWTYNLGVHCCGTGVGTMHVWDESQASRGSQEIGSCVLVYLKEHRTTATHLTCYSDRCGGQNRNINMLCLFQHIVCSADYSYTTVDHKFMICGHSYMPNDRDFGGIEKARRRTTSPFTPEERCTLIENARRVNPFRVRKMERKDFVSTTQLTGMIVNHKTNLDAIRLIG